MNNPTNQRGPAFAAAVAICVAYGVPFVLGVIVGAVIILISACES